MSEAEDLFAEACRLHRGGELQAAADLYRAVARSGLTVNLACNLALCLAALGDLDEALAWLGEAIGHKPDDPRVLDASLRLGFDLLMAGRYAEGWPLMEARAQLHPETVGAIDLPFPEWKGEPLDGKSIVILQEQGLGDQIMFVRFARQLAAQGARVSAMCRPSLATLFRQTPRLSAVIPIGRGERVGIGDYDYWTRYFSLPLHLGVRLETLPAEPYLAAPEDRLARWAGYPGPARIGVVWRTSPTGALAGFKTLPEDQAARLLGLGAIPLHPEDTGAADFADTAAIVAQLDLVISVDTAVAHLAGAMGKPCWTLLPPEAVVDWRWMRQRSDSPWYPSMRLFRRETGADWAGVVDRVVAARG